MGKPKYYVVWRGNEPGIYDSWPKTREQIDGFGGAKYKSFTNKEEAEEAFDLGYDEFKKQEKEKETLKAGDGSSGGNIPVWKSISVDAACSGNPGDLEYRGVETDTGKVLFHQGPYPNGTVNIGEFLAIVHGLAILKEQGSDLPIYSDSKTARAWVRRKKHNTKLKMDRTNVRLFKMLERAEKWLKNNSFKNEILTWETKNWGEIPADFGRK